MTSPELAHDVRIVDTTLRDGSHAMAHQFTDIQVRDTVRALDAAGVEWTEVSHGDGIGGSSFNYGFSGTDEMHLIAAAREEARRARIAVLLVPGIGTVEDLKRARDAGAEMVRVATHCTEADVSPQHFAAARELGMETVGFLMMAHKTSPEGLAKQARIMVDAGCQCPYVTDSAGALLMHEAKARFDALTAEVGDEAWVGYHGTRTCPWAWRTQLSPMRPECARSTARCVPLAPARATHRPRYLPLCSTDSASTPAWTFPPLLDAAEEVVRPYLQRWSKMNRNAIVQGWAGVYSSFLLHAERAAERDKVPAHHVLKRCGDLGYVGGQEDVIIDVAIQLAAEQGTDA